MIAAVASSAMTVSSLIMVSVNSASIETGPRIFAEPLHVIGSPAVVEKTIVEPFR